MATRSSRWCRIRDASRVDDMVEKKEVNDMMESYQLGILFLIAIPVMAALVAVLMSRRRA